MHLHATEHSLNSGFESYFYRFAASHTQERSGDPGEQAGQAGCALASTVVPGSHGCILIAGHLARPTSVTGAQARPRFSCLVKGATVQSTAIGPIRPGLIVFLSTFYQTQYIQTNIRTS